MACFTNGLGALGGELYVLGKLTKLRKVGQYLRRKNPVEQLGGVFFSLREQRSNYVQARSLIRIRRGFRGDAGRNCWLTSPAFFPMSSKDRFGRPSPHDVDRLNQSRTSATPNRPLNPATFAEKPLVSDIMSTDKMSVTLYVPDKMSVTLYVPKCAMCRRCCPPRSNPQSA